MNNNQKLLVKDLLAQSNELKNVSIRIRELATQICDHKKENGSFNVAQDCPKPICCMCGLEANCIQGWKRISSLE